MHLDNPSLTIRRGARAALAASVGALAIAMAAATPASADGPGAGTPTIVTVGDSLTSGEAGRWAGNTRKESYRVDALGPTAYWDASNGESIPGCHRSRSAEVHIGDGVLSYNLACSGAKTTTAGTGWWEAFKPGIDFYADSSGRVGQARALQQLAATRNVKAVVVTIGANNYGFEDIVKRCVWNYSTPQWGRNYCSDDDDMTSRFSATRIATETNNVFNALHRVRLAMSNAGYSTSQYTIVAQTYWSPLPYGSGIRYPEVDGGRDSTGGCGVWNLDADWVNTTVVPSVNRTLRDAVAKSALPNVRILDLQSALVGRRLCERGVGLLEEMGLGTFNWTGAVDKTEWVAQIRAEPFGDYQVQESIHANNWGQKAMRSCLRQAYNGGLVRGGACVRVADGLTARGEPQMALR